MPKAQYSHRSKLHGTLSTTTVSNPGPVVHAITLKPICSCDILVFKTETPDNHPLPSSELLDMQWRLTRAVALSGVAGLVPRFDLESGSDSDPEGEEDVEDEEEEEVGEGSICRCPEYTYGWGENHYLSSHFSLF
ncbi:hypothetical protein BJX76DRAFT_316620 [Aspergillus varians]